MRVAVLVALFVVAGLIRTSAYQHFVSPNGRFEAYTTANAPDGTGMKLLLRAAGSRDDGTLLWKNNRWLDARWSPDSRFLANIDHLDGHIADVYVFGISARNPAGLPIATLFYHTPELRTYDVQWDVVDWLSDTRSIILRKNVHFGFRQETIVAHIGTTALKPQYPDQT
jgi:hypothetical protein